MDLFGKRARDERIRKETATATRAELTSALADFPPRITELVTAWYQSLAVNTRQAVNQWFAARVADQKTALHNRFSEQIESLMGQISAVTMQKLAEKHRQKVIKTVGKQGKELFATSMHRRSAEMLLEIQNTVERSRGGIHSGEEALPNGTRFFFQYANGSRIYVIEQPPAVRTVRIAGYERSNEYRNYRLAFPFFVFIAHFNRDRDFCCLYAFFRNERLRSMQDTLYTPALPNINSGDCRVCFPDLEKSERGLPTMEKMERILNNFWGSGFNTDLPRQFVRSMESIGEISSIERWQKNTAKNPQFVLKLPWLLSQRGTLAETVRIISQLHERGQAPDDNRLVNASATINRIAERVAEDIMESALKLIPRWKIEEVPAQVLAAELNKLLSEGAESLARMVDESAQEIFSQMPNMDHVTAESERLRVKFNRAVDEKIKWIGLIPTVTQGNDKE